MSFGISGDLRAEDDPKRRKHIEEYRNHLSNLPPTELAALLTSEQENEARERREAADRQEKQRFFNLPTALADFDHWSKAAHWTLDEAIALSLGKAPEIVTWDNVKAHTKISSFAFQYQRRRDLALRAVVGKQLYDPVLPGSFLAWAKRLDIPVPQKLEAAVVARGGIVRDWQSLFDELKKKTDENHARWMEIVDQRDKQIATLSAQLDGLQSEANPATSGPRLPKEKVLGTRERESLLKLVIGMAVAGYVHDPKASRSGTAREIASDLQKVGLSLDEDTIRKYLVEAKDLLPGDETEQAR